MSVLATDSFIRANANPIGGNWTTETSFANWKIQSNTAEPSSEASDCAAYYNAISWPNDHYAQSVITTVPAFTSSGDGPGVGCRMSSSAKTNYEGCTGNGGAHTSLAKRVATVYTQIGTSSTDFANGDTIYIEAQGTQIKVKKNGANLISVSDAAIASGNAGIVHSGESAVLTQLNTWEGGDFASTGLNPGKWLTDMERPRVIGKEIICY